MDETDPGGARRAQELARQWWSLSFNQGRPDALCDVCSALLPRDQGYLCGLGSIPELQCGKCFQKHPEGLTPWMGGVAGLKALEARLAGRAERESSFLAELWDRFMDWVKSKTIWALARRRTKQEWERSVAEYRERHRTSSEK